MVKHQRDFFLEKLCVAALGTGTFDHNCVCMDYLLPPNGTAFTLSYFALLPYMHLEPASSSHQQRPVNCSYDESEKQPG